MNLSLIFTVQPSLEDSYREPDDELISLLSQSDKKSHFIGEYTHFASLIVLLSIIIY
jgi:hypothetical protein